MEFFRKIGDGDVNSIIALISVILGLVSIFLAVYLEIKNKLQNTITKGSTIKTKWANSNFENISYGANDAFNITTIYSKVNWVELKRDIRDIEQVEYWSANAEIIHKYNECKDALENLAMISKKYSKKVRGIWKMTSFIETNMKRNNSLEIKEIEKRIYSLPGKETIFKIN